MYIAHTILYVKMSMDITSEEFWEMHRQWRIEQKEKEKEKANFLKKLEYEVQLQYQKKLACKRESKIARRFVFTFPSFFVKTIFQITMTLILLNRYGLIMVHDLHYNNYNGESQYQHPSYYYYKNNRHYDEFEENNGWWVRQVNNTAMHIPKSVTYDVVDKLTLIPKKFYNSPNDIFYNEINGELNLFDVFRDTHDMGMDPNGEGRITSNYKKASCNISFHWDNIDCDEKCMEVMAKYEIDQKNDNVLICYYEMEYNAWWHNLQINIFYIILYGIGQLLSFSFAESMVERIYEESFSKIAGRLDDREYKWILRLYEFFRMCFDLFANLVVNFIWCDLLTWAFNPVNGSMNLYHNIILSNGYADYNKPYIKKMEINLPGVFLFALNWGTSWMFLVLFWICIPAKIIFSIGNMFSVFSIGFLNIDIVFGTIKNIFTFEYTTFFFTPQFWYNFNIFIFPFLMNFIFDADKYFFMFVRPFIFIKSQCVSMNEWFCDKMKKTELPTIELPEISVETKEETQKVNENELQIEIRKTNI